MTAASPNLPFGTVLCLYNPKTNRNVLVRINDRGPFVKGRSLDLSASAASYLGMIGNGTATLAIKFRILPRSSIRFYGVN